MPKSQTYPIQGYTTSQSQFQVPRLYHKPNPKPKAIPQANSQAAGSIQFTISQESRSIARGRAEIYIITWNGTILNRVALSDKSRSEPENYKIADKRSRGVTDDWVYICLGTYLGLRVVLEVEISPWVLNRAVPVNKILRNGFYMSVAPTEYPTLLGEELGRSSSWILNLNLPVLRVDRDLMRSCPDNSVSAYSEHDLGQVLSRSRGPSRVPFRCKEM
ncbi:hypothetical protein DFH06DRAFT_1131478 [Mycena polygramma]|nr:hypothetical protein DFH06DRAFT_1131478 [Mycena polygramma]